MKIRRIEIIGFKSFVDRTVLEFPDGVTAVVGPNGCGKSNVVDAIRWVMGEQSAKNLRGRAMEDIIFAGSENRRSLGMAEVSLVFSTEDGRVPAKYLDYSEIQVTRRLYRDGDSEYFLNKTPCRLLDINELFMDTGVGARAYSIIEQGRIGMILMAKPEERRFLIEEAAGVTKFKSRKQVALKKIESTRQNLLRIGDVVAEIKRQLGSLQRQAKKAERFKMLRDELRSIEVSFAVRSHRELGEVVARLEGERTRASDNLSSLSGQLSGAEASLEQQRLKIVEEERALAAAQEEIFRIKSDAQGCVSRLDFQRKELENGERSKVKSIEELAALSARQTEAIAEAKALEEQYGALLVEEKGEEEQLSSRSAALELLVAEEGALVRRQETGRQELIAILNRLSQLNNRFGEADRRLARLAERIERSTREGGELNSRLGSAAARVAELRITCTAAAEQKRALAKTVEDFVVLSGDLGSRLRSVEESLQAVREELSSARSRLASLNELEAQFAGYGQGVRTIMKAEPFTGRFHGLVADLVETDPEYEAAVEALLGERLQYVVCRDEADALAAVSHLAGQSGGKCSFITPGWGDATADNPPESAIPILGLVRITVEQQALIEPLLANSYLAADLASALALSRRYPRFSFVTRTGELAAQGGIVTGGVTEGGGEGLIHTKREIRELTVKVAELGEQVAALETDRGNLKDELLTAEDSLRKTRQELHQSEVRFVALEKDLLRGEEDVQRIEERIEVKGVEDEQLAEEKLGLEKERADADSGRRELESDKTRLEAESATLQSDLAARRKEIEVLREGVTGIKVLVATLQEKREANRRSVKRVEALLADIAVRMATVHDDQEKGVEDQERLRLEIAEGEAALKLLLEQQAAAEAAHAGLRDRFESQSALLQEKEAALKTLREQLGGERDSASERQLKIAELSMQLRHLESSMQERYRIDLTALPPVDLEAEFDEPAMRARQGELQRQVDEIGEVNLMAIDEYRELDERHTFLSEQKADLEDSLQELQKAIQRINRTTRKRFLETFQLVNEKFREVFPRLFCGGQAELRLTNEEDLLETGIEIIVQPPGKKLQNVSLLSGGEKALTAVALIFSIFLVKPSPFCLLDEVDAPLDDVNIGRFNEMIREMTAFSQFILITHSKTTMAVADTLYGVTMEEPGVSKVVSVRLQ
ncbi:chromosome segregation protein SMC [Geobacter pelophilus]|uniref:Chromosome partition protein Smc n=1 Tax=Geoanaerobacter pelophilus TaxID=60036 RepID=A0AAW4L948_9BACT|nr:chromosome segregation protein SMC [Geoanaerobacter pelophilus]MBT0666095.1 chromosome segregation protein SMC [Geoanaerobacter pelophilus]